MVRYSKKSVEVRASNAHNSTRRGPSNSPRQVSRSPRRGSESSDDSDILAMCAKQAIESGLWIPAGVSKNRLLTYLVPVEHSNGRVEWVCRDSIAHALRLGRTCKLGSQRCKNKHLGKVCNYHLANPGSCRHGEDCRFHHIKLWSPEVKDESQTVFSEESSVSCGGGPCCVPCVSVSTPRKEVSAIMSRVMAAPTTEQREALRGRPETRPIQSNPRRKSPGKKTMLCTYQQKNGTQCPHCRRGRCHFAKSLAEQQRTDEEEALHNVLSNPTKFPNFFEDVRAELVRVSEDSDVVKFFRKDKSDIFQRGSIPGPNDFGGLLNWWSSLASRVRGMRSGKINLPTGVEKSEVPTLTLWPEHGYENIREATVWALVTHTKVCYKEDCSWGVNCRSGTHLPERTTDEDYLNNVVITDYVEFDYIVGSRGKTDVTPTLHRMEDYLKNRSELTQKRESLLTEKYGSGDVNGFKRSDRDIDNDLTAINKRLKRVNDNLHGCWVANDLSDFPKLKKWDDIGEDTVKEYVPIDGPHLVDPAEVALMEKKKAATKVIREFAARCPRLRPP